ncbi:hypothetical protein BLD25_03915 [Candidatus Gracilibacteria bacterium GN02-872]|nr:hypothetical protein BLD25_03915 [Candidatus Gracilibacteria bacterium GN02-872]RKW23469.1 MAG: prepilin-type N-terminal cleavage/methylation domain-containing protein [Candidatus Gracilibacteria bacterium]
MIIILLILFFYKRNMKNSKKGFTLVELLVVITILAIISVVAYQSFSGATDKANASRKLQDVTTIESGLQQYFANNNFYPPVDLIDTSKNKYGYDKAQVATPSNTLTVTKTGVEIKEVNAATGGGKIMGKGDYSSKQIGAKGTISQETLGKQYLTKDLYDPELGDMKVGSDKMIDKGIGRYVYAVYKKPTGNDWGNDNNTGTYYNIAYTVKKDGTEDYETKIVGPYDNKSCIGKENDCPETLIGSGENILKNNQISGKTSDGKDLPNFDSKQPNQGIPYPLGNF